jgi:hypothetical protein
MARRAGNGVNSPARTVSERHNQIRNRALRQFDLNWFFNGHKNKLTGEVSYFKFLGGDQDYNRGLRYRVQWDISL